MELRPGIPRGKSTKFKNKISETFVSGACPESNRRVIFVVSKGVRGMVQAAGIASGKFAQAAKAF